MRMSAELCRIRAMQCLEIALQLAPPEREPLFNMAESWLRLAQTGLATRHGPLSKDE